MRNVPSLRRGVPERCNPRRRADDRCAKVHRLPHHRGRAGAVDRPRRLDFRMRCVPNVLSAQPPNTPLPRSDLRSPIRSPRPHPCRLATDERGGVLDALWHNTHHALRAVAIAGKCKIKGPLRPPGLPRRLKATSRNTGYTSIYRLHKSSICRIGWHKTTFSAIFHTFYTQSLPILAKLYYLCDLTL